MALARAARIEIATVAPGQDQNPTNPVSHDASLAKLIFCAKKYISLKRGEGDVKKHLRTAAKNTASLHQFLLRRLSHDEFAGGS